MTGKSQSRDFPLGRKRYLKQPNLESFRVRLQRQREVSIYKTALITGYFFMLVPLYYSRMIIKRLNGNETGNFR